MAATTDQLERLRRMVADPERALWDDTTLRAELERYPLLDSDGLDPDDDAWVATYDLNAAAASLWEERASTEVARIDYSADGGSFSASQLYEHCVTQANRYRARRSATTIRQRPEPRIPYSDSLRDTYVGNLAEIE